MNKYILQIAFSLILSFNSALVFAVNVSDKLTNIEQNLYGYDYTNQSDENRIIRLENSIYGKTFTGDLNLRLDKISSDISADVFGKEISPKEDSFNEESETIADNSVNYPIINEVEQKLFNTTYSDRDLHTRIVTIEKKLFGKIYDIDDYATRVERIKSEIMPDRFANSRFEHEYRDNKLSSDDLSGTGFSRFNMPFGQRKYTRPYLNYGDSYTGGASPTTYNENTNLNNELSELELETFGTEFSNEDTSSRIKRLNSVNKAQKSASRYDSQKFSQRMSTAMEIGAMILMILAMVL